NKDHLKALEAWMRSYRPDELFDEHGRLRSDVAALAPKGDRRMGANPHANGGRLLRDLVLPDFRDYGVEVKEPGTTSTEPTRVLGTWLRDVFEANAESSNFRLFGPDETESNRLGAVYEATPKAWEAAVLPVDQNLSPDGRVMEILSEHTCQGWLEGYLLTGRHGLFSCYEAFIHIVDSMFNQHAKWLKVTRHLEWRRPIGSLNYLLTSHVWRQDNNGFSHQDPGFIDHVVNKKAEVVRVYLPPDANTLLSAADVEGARRERRRPDAPAARDRAPPRPVGPRLRHRLHRRPTGDLRLSRVPVAHPPPVVPPVEPRQLSRPRLQGGGHDDHAVRHGDDERHGPLPPGDGRHRPGARARRASRAPAPGDDRPAGAGPGMDA